MLILAFDTSSPLCTVAVASDEGPLSEVSVWAPREHMRRLLPLIDTALAEAGVERSQIEALVLGSGPGSFTGLRIGATIAKTLARLLDVKILGVSSLDAIAQDLAPGGGIICPVVDAKRGAVYAAFYRRADEGPAQTDDVDRDDERTSDGQVLVRLTEYRAYDPGDLCALISLEGYERVLLAGDGIAAYREVFVDTLGDTIRLAPRRFWWPRAGALAAIALPRLAAGEADDPLRLVPIYARIPQAEETWRPRSE